MGTPQCARVVRGFWRRQGRVPLVLCLLGAVFVSFFPRPALGQRVLRRRSQKVFLKVNTEKLRLVWNGDQGDAGRGKGEVYGTIWIYWPTATEHTNPQHRTFGPLGGDNEFPSGTIVEEPVGSGSYTIRPAEVTDGQFGQIYYNEADCDVATSLVLDILIWDEDSNDDLEDFLKQIQDGIKAAKAQAGGQGRVLDAVDLAARIIGALVLLFTDSGDDALGRFTGTISISDPCDGLFTEIKTIELDNLATALWNSAPAESENGVEYDDPPHRLTPPAKIGSLDLKIIGGPKQNKFSSIEVVDASTATLMRSVDLGQSDEAVVTAAVELGATLPPGPISAKYSVFLDVDNNLATGAQGYPVDGAEFALALEFAASETASASLLAYDAANERFETVPGGLYDARVNVNGAALFLSVELETLGNPVGPIAAWGVVEEEGTVVDVVPEFPAETAVGIIPDSSPTGIAPMVVSTSPPGGSIDIDRTAGIRILFSKSMNREATQQAIALDPQTPLSFSWQGSEVSLVAAEALAPNTRYTVTIAASATDRVGTPLDGNGDLEPGDDFAWGFTTATLPLWAADRDGQEKNAFDEGEPVFVSGSDFAAGAQVDIAVVTHDRVHLVAGAQLTDVTDAGITTAEANADGELQAVAVGRIPMEGEYNIIVDVGRDGGYDPDEDRCDKTGIGFAVLPGDGVPFKRGDVNGDGSVDIGDAVFVLTYLFGGGHELSCFKASDANDEGRIDLADAITILGHLFRGAGPLPAPFENCGRDETPDELTCESFVPCE